MQKAYLKNLKKLTQFWEQGNPDEIHHFLISKGFSPRKNLNMLDIGCGSGRDAGWATNLGAKVVAVDILPEMLKVAQESHPDPTIKWICDTLPEISKVSGRFDVILISGVWQHLLPIERKKSLIKLETLLSKKGVIYISLRLGEPDLERCMLKVSLRELYTMIKNTNLKILDISCVNKDFLNRNNVAWQSVLLTKN